MKVSLVIPVKNEADSIVRLLDSIAAQTRQPDETIIVDGGSEDGTPEIIERWAQQHVLGVGLRLLRVREASPGKGRNLGIAAASHSWIALTDAGIELEPTWLERLLEVAERDPAIQVVYGNYEPLAESFYERCAALAYVAPKRPRPDGLMRGPLIASSLLDRQVWQSVGGFPDLRAAEDQIFMRRIDEQGCRIGWASTATVWWQIPPGFKATFQKMALYSQHNVWAGEQKHWHYGIARLYLLAALVASFLLLLHPLWLLLLPIIALTRPWQSIWLCREGRSIWWTLNPVRLVMVGAILVTIDLATFVGWARAVAKLNRNTQHRYSTGSVSDPILPPEA